MSQQEYIITLERQLRTLNQRIDSKIMSGQKYVEEARKHRMIVRKIREQKREGKTGIISRVFPLFA